jgi:UTP--glucose-1-phosphate uridylyltransferase
MDQNGEPKSALQIVLEEAAGAGIEEFCVVVCPGDETAYAKAGGGSAAAIEALSRW